MRLYVTTATGVLSTDTAPVGGGVAVLEAWLPDLARRGVDVTVLRPGPSERTTAAGGIAVRELAVPTLASGERGRILALSERAYARFALEWERALETFFEGIDPKEALVVANDVSEGPPFDVLARRGFRQAVIYHVVVGEFFARQYLRPLGLSAAAAARWWRRGERLGVGRVLPELLKLVWSKEEAAARSAIAICPSWALADSLAALYPSSGVAARTHVVPWGVIGEPDPGRRARREDVLRALGVDPGRFVITTMSRLSREKRLELALDALERIARARPELADRLALVVAGAPAYMGGDAYARKIERRARSARRVAVTFAGYVAGGAKWDLLAASDLFLSTSSYEAYGLGIAQALASGTPVVATAHEGARAILCDHDGGWIVEPDPGALAGAIAEATETDLAPRRAAAQAWGRAQRFDRAADQLAAILAIGPTSPVGAGDASTMRPASGRAAR